MKKRYALVAAMLLSGGIAATAVAQQDSTPVQRPMRMRMHVPGTGMSDSVVPMRQRMGPGMPGMPGRMGLPGMQPGMMQGRMGPMGQGGMLPGMNFYTPGALLQQRGLLDLTDQQVSQLEKLQSDLEAANQKAQTDAQTNGEALMKAWQEAKPNPDALRTRAQAMMQAHQASALATIGAAAQAKSLLSTEQQAKMQGWIAGHGGRGMRPGARMGMRGMQGRAGMERARRAPRAWRWF